MIKISYKNKLHPGQQDLWDRFILDDSIIEASVNSGRRWGKTVFCKRAALYWLINNPGCEVGYLAPETNNFIKVFRWFQSELESIIVKSSSIPNYIIKLKNGSSITFWSMKNHTAIRGQGFDYAICDEFAHGQFSTPDCIDSYGATLAEAGKVLYVSTPIGKNVHYHKFQQCIAQNNRVHYEAITADNPFIPKEFIADKKLELPEHRFQQEFMGKFVDGGGEVFTGIDVVSLINKWSPQELNSRYVYGIDWGSKNDKSVLTIINTTTNSVVNITTSYSDDYTIIGKQFADILSNYDVIYGYAETNGVGQSQFDHFKKQVRSVEPFTTSQQSKDLIVTHLRSLIQNKQILLPSRDLCPELYLELSDYEARVSANGKYSYGHPKGKHDDYVDSLMFAVWAMKPQFQQSSRTTKVRNHRNPFR